VAREAKVRVSVLDVQGRVMAVLVDGLQRAGRHQVVWSGETARGGIAPAGLYFIRYQAPGKDLVKRVTLAR
jgi:flagellar hook assembly protein FlgD